MSGKTNNNKQEPKIEELRQVKEDFARTKELFLKAFLLSPVATVITSISDSKIIQVNEAFTTLTGYRHDEVVGRSTVDVNIWANNEEHRTMLSLLREKKSLEKYHTQIRTTSGEIRECFFSAEIFNLYNEQFVISTAIDITRFIKAEEDLGESEERHRLFFENSPIGIIHYSREGIITDVNDAMATIFGSSRDNLIGLNIDYVPDKKFSAEIYKSLNGEHAYYEDEYTSYTGNKKVVIKASWIPIIHKGEVISGVGIVEDVTDRRLAEDALRKSEGKYRFLTENVSDLIWTADMNGYITFATASAKTLMGYSVEELLEMKIWDCLTPESGKYAFKVIQERLSIENKRRDEELDPVILELEFIRKDNSMGWGEATVRVIRDDHQNPVGFIGVTRDVTVKKKLEVQLRQAQKMEAIGTLAGGIAHDFNNLLMGILGNISMTLLDMNSSNPYYERLKMVEEYVRKGAELAKQLLGFARGGKYEVKAADINELIRNQNQMFGRTRGEINIRGKYGKDIWMVKVDCDQIDKVLLNLYENAWQAMPGGGELFVQTENIILDEDYVMPHNVPVGKYVKISVTDTGIGMDEDTLQKIFDPFFTTREMERGTGMGLASAYGIIKNHGGFIEVYSKKDEGSTFNVYLPWYEEPAEKEKEVVARVATEKRTVLLVDDQTMIIEVGKEIIEHLGYDVLTALNGKEALRVYRKNNDKIELVILDMVMPDMGGGKTYDKLKEINPHIKVLLSSGYSLTGEAREIMDRGCNGFIQKPFSIPDLSKKISTILLSY